MIAALIIATGKTARKGSFAPAKTVGSIPAIQRIIMTFRRADIERIVVVCEGDTEKLAAHMNVIYLPGCAESEMLNNVKFGLAYLQDKCTAALITHADVPLFSVETVRALLDKDESPVCIPFYQGKTGHPLLLRTEHFPAVAAYSGTQGLSGALKAAGLPCRFVKVADEGVLVNINNNADYGHLLKAHSLRTLHPDIKLRIAREKPFFGPGAQQLLQLTMETNSLREACRQMGISYSKGRHIIAVIEEQLEQRVIESQQGGASGGYSIVTEAGQELMRNYTAFCAEARRNLQELFGRYFSG